MGDLLRGFKLNQRNSKLNAKVNENNQQTQIHQKEIKVDNQPKEQKVGKNKKCNQHQNKSAASIQKSYYKRLQTLEQVTSELPDIQTEIQIVNDGKNFRCSACGVTIGKQASKLKEHFQNQKHSFSKHFMQKQKDFNEMELE